MVTPSPVTRDLLNADVKKLAAKDRPAAVAILARFNVLTTAELLKPEDIAACHAAFIEALS